MRPPSRISATRSPSSSATCAASVGLTRPERLAEGAAIGRPVARSKACATAWAGRPDRDRVEPGARQQRQAAVVATSQHEGQRPRPESRGRPASTTVENGEGLGLGQRGDMDDQRVEARPALSRENLGDGALVGRIAAEPIDGLGREGDEPAGAQQRGGAGDRPGGGG